MKTGYPADKYRLSVASHMNEPRLSLVPLALARKRHLEITLKIFDMRGERLEQVTTCR